MNPNQPAPQIQSGNDQIRRLRAALEAVAPRVLTDSAEEPEGMPAMAAAVIELYTAASLACEELEFHLAEDRTLAEALFCGLLSEASGWDESPHSDLTYDDIVKMPDARALDALSSFLPSDLIAPARAVLRRLDTTRFDATT